MFPTQSTRKLFNYRQTSSLLPVDLLSRKDVCPFCRGTISIVLHSGLLQKSTGIGKICL